MTATDSLEEIEADTLFVRGSVYRQDVLAQLAEGPAIPSQIADAAESDLIYASRAVCELREQSLVEFLVSDATRKGRIYRLTDRGTTIMTLVEE
jgi:DNA-binding MarR family transcriptional regulator